MCVWYNDVLGVQKDQSKEVSLKLKGYLEVYETLLRLKEELRAATEMLVRGDSPYVKLGIVRDMAEDARNKWHTIESKLLEEEAND